MSISVSLILPFFSLGVVMFAGRLYASKKLVLVTLSTGQSAKLTVNSEHMGMTYDRVFFFVARLHHYFLSSLFVS